MAERSEGMRKYAMLTDSGSTYFVTLIEGRGQRILKYGREPTGYRFLGSLEPQLRTEEELARAPPKSERREYKSPKELEDALDFNDILITDLKPELAEGDHLVGWDPKVPPGETIWEGDRRKGRYAVSARIVYLEEVDPQTPADDIYWRLHERRLEMMGATVAKDPEPWTVGLRDRMIAAKERLRAEAEKAAAPSRAEVPARMEQPQPEDKAPESSSDVIYFDRLSKAERFELLMDPSRFRPAGRKR